MKECDILRAKNILWPLLHIFVGSKVHGGKGKDAHTWYSASSWWISTAEALRYGTCSQGISQFYLHTHTFIRDRNEPYLPSPSQPQLVLICRSRRDGRLSRPWCEVAQARIRTCNLPIAHPPHSTTQPLAHPVTTPTPRICTPTS